MLRASLAGAALAKRTAVTILAAGAAGLLADAGALAAVDLRAAVGLVMDFLETAMMVNLNLNLDPWFEWWMSL